MTEGMGSMDDRMAGLCHRMGSGMGHLYSLCDMILLGYVTPSVRPVFSHGVSPWPRTSTLVEGGEMIRCLE